MIPRDYPAAAGAHTLARMQRRIVRYPAADAGGAATPAEVPSLLWEIYRRRGVADPRETERGLDRLLPPQAMAGLEDAAGVLCDAVTRDRRVLVVGDFDADGATSCALAVLALRACGCRDVDYLVPNRFTFGYGLTPEIVDHARPRAPDVLVTVDNGISSIDGVEAANRLGWDVVITDHHLPGARLPAARAVVNPNVPGNPFPSKAMAGVGVIFYVLLGVRQRLRESGWFVRRGISEPNMADYLDLVALGTVADVVPLDHNNRILVHQGLQRIRRGRCRPGITALLQVAGRNPSRARETDLGFAVGPRLNAAGRLDDMSIGIACLLADDERTARGIAERLDGLNRERRTIEQQMKDQAEAMLATWQPGIDGELPWGLSLYQDGWHQGVVGLVASRIKERYHRPVIAFADADGGELKGSGRSIPGLHIRDVLDDVAAREPGLLYRFGGHAMAAGLSLPRAHLDRFSQLFDRCVRDRLDERALQPTIWSDGPVPADALTVETALTLRDGGPWGQGFSEPMFDDHFEVLSQRVVGERHWRLVVRPADSDAVIDAIAFNAVEAFSRVPDRIHAAYRLDDNEWQGRVSVQLRFEHIQEPTA